mmetsp:Transcript_13845/g.28196  ORF Transcript_13845/g.28196 Transcript_13845/m.28196 type:complete len:733 (-) Transcript_13845:28-2226(-)
MAALTGDDEIEMLLSQMGGGGDAAIATTTASEVTTTTKKEKERPQKRKKKKKRKRDTSDGVTEVSTSFADTRLTQNPFEWPCSHKNSQRRLVLGFGLAHDCNGYTCDNEAKLYGSTSCLSCGKSAATHELCISSSDMKIDTDEDPISVLSIASMIVSTRNARCLMAEYYPNESEKHHKHLSPPINSLASTSKLIMNRLDTSVGKVLGKVKKMESNRTASVLISSSDVDLLREKVSELVKTTIAYKEAIKATCSSNTNATKNAGLALIEARLAALAACDEVYYRCYYAYFFFGSANQADLTSLVPHPPTYFTCPGLAWDAKDSGSASLGMFLGEMKHDGHSSTSFAAPLDDGTRELLLKSWCLQERLTSTKALITEQSNPLLTLWQSRFLESLRHLWTTHYAFVKSPLALGAALNMKHCDDHSDPLIRHETYGLSPAAETWRGSIRDYPANFYGYAVPTLAAVSKVLGNEDSIVEAGAGTGYLSALLASHLKKDRIGTVFPYDIAPPRQANAGAEVASNEYHGQVPTFIDVHQAQSFEQAQSMLTSTGANASLLLCYPPPASEMAAIALSQYIARGGQSVLHVGEWQGMTGNKTFESMLHDNFYCEEKDIIPLPIWGTDATYLTIWRMKSGNNIGTQSFSPAIGYCSEAQCSNLARRRCRFARCLQYCSEDCFQTHAAVRRAILALHLIHLSPSNEMDYENVNHFVPLSWVAGRHVEDGGQSRKKRKRKKHNK